MFKNLLIAFVVVAVCSLTATNAVSIRQVTAEAGNTGTESIVNAPVAPDAATVDTIDLNSSRSKDSDKKGDKDEDKYSEWEGSGSIEYDDE